MAAKETPKGRKPARGTRVGEPAAVYRVNPTAERDVTIATTRLSGKNQITIPVAMCRMMDMRPGDEIELLVVGDTVYLQRLPRTPEEWGKRFDNSPSTPGWGTDAEIDEYVRRERESWDKEYDWPKPTS
jgi:bifunctional DNA-binding transcriptional regulator/antitoxin component of YhaV-PrlF toxin-antitoxin module